MSSKQKSQFKTVSLIMIITLVGKVLGLLRDILLNRNFGYEMDAQAFTVASQLPRTFFDVIFASAISASFIPIFNEYMEKDGREEADRFSGSFMTLIGLFTALLAVVGIIFAPQLIEFSAGGYTAETKALATQLLRILFPMIIFTGLAFSMVAVLQSLGEFNIPALISVVSNGLIILYYLFFVDNFGVFGLAVAFLIGWAAQMAIQVPSLHRLGYRYRPRLWHKGIRSVLVLMVPVMVGSWLQPINQFFSSRFGSYLFDGKGTTAINNANTLYLIIASVLVLSITNVIFPKLSRLVIAEEKKAFGQVLKENTRTVLFLLIPMTAGLIVLSEPIIRLIFGYGEMTDFDIQITGRALAFLSLGMVGFGIQSILSRAFYAMKKGLIPLITSGVAIGVNIGLGLLLMDRWDVAGIGVASSVSLSLAAILLVIPIQRRFETYIDKQIVLDFFKMIAAALVMAAVLIPVRTVLSELGSSLFHQILTVGIPAVLGVAIYMALTLLMRVAEAQTTLGAVTKIFKRGGPKNG